MCQFTCIQVLAPLLNKEVNITALSHRLFIEGVLLLVQINKDTRIKNVAIYCMLQLNAFVRC